MTAVFTVASIYLPGIHPIFRIIIILVMLFYAQWNHKALEERGAGRLGARLKGTSNGGPTR